MICSVTTTSSEQTIALGRELGRCLRGGECIELIADIGGGKTIFTRGILAGLGYNGPVPSPTFTISRVYDLKDGKRLYHCDFYRLHQSDAATAELGDVFADQEAIVVVEWAEQVPGVLPGGHIIIRICGGMDESERHIEILVPDEQKYLIEGLDV